MFFALNNDGNRVYSYQAGNGTYFCPVCGEKVVLRDGGINSPHFAHLPSKECLDGWHYDMSEWHLKMQNCFSNKHREVIVSKNGVSHRADVLKDGVVIEFQHSSISEEEFWDRNDFYFSCGYRVAWVFDVTEQMQNKSIDFSNNDDDCSFSWKNPKRLLATVPYKMANEKNFALWIAFRSYDDGEEYSFRKIIWANDNYSRFIVSPFDICLNEQFICDSLFFSKDDWLNQELKKYNFSYEIKYNNRKGFARNKYYCPISKEFLHLSGENGCTHCKYCIAIREKPLYTNGFRTKHFFHEIYCYYPHIAQNCNDAENENDYYEPLWIN